MATEDVMATEIPTISPSGDVMDAYREMQQNDGGLVTVVDEHGTFVGLISRTAVLRAFQVLRSGDGVQPKRFEQPSGTQPA